MNADRENRWPTPREFVDEWGQATDEQRLARAERMVNDAQMASRCFVMDHENHIAMLERRLSSATRLADAGTPPSAPKPSQAATEAHGDDERVRKYAEVLHEYDPEANGPYVLTEYLAAAASAVIEVANAEQAELRAEVERLQEALYAADERRRTGPREAATLRRAEAAEAMVARDEALAEAFHQEGLDLGAASYQIGTDAQDASDDLARESETWRAAAERVRTALDGSAKPETP